MTQLVSTWLNTKWSTRVYMIKKNSDDIFFIKLRRPKAEELLWYCVYMLFVPRVQDTCTKIWELSGYITPRTHCSHFLDGSITDLCALRASVKIKRSSSLRVYSHDLKLQGTWKTILFLHDFVLLLKNNLKCNTTVSSITGDFVGLCNQKCHVL